MDQKWHRTDEVLPEMANVPGGMVSPYVLVFSTSQPAEQSLAIMRLEDFGQERLWRGPGGDTADLFDVSFWRRLPPAPPRTKGPNRRNRLASHPS